MKSICWFKKNSYVKREQIRWLSSPFPKLSQCITVCKQHCISPVSSPPPLEPRLQNSLVIKWARDSRCGNGVHVKRQQHLPSAHHRRREIPPDFITACLPALNSRLETDNLGESSFWDHSPPFPKGLRFSSQVNIFQKLEGGFRLTHPNQLYSRHSPCMFQRCAPPPQTRVRRSSVLRALLLLPICQDGILSFSLQAWLLEFAFYF